MDLYDQIQDATSYLRSRWKGTPAVGIILGTGLGGLTEDIQADVSIPYGDIPHFPKSTAPSHKGNLVCGTLGGKPVVAMEGRFHFYEGYSLQKITFPVRVMKALGLSDSTAYADVLARKLAYTNTYFHTEPSQRTRGLQRSLGATNRDRRHLRLYPQATPLPYLRDLHDAARRSP